LPPNHVFEFGDGDDVTSALRFVCRNLGVSPPSLATAENKPAATLYRNRFHDYTLDVSGWSPCQEELHPQFGPVVKSETRRGENRLVWNLLVQTRPDLTPRPLPDAGGSMDDRTCFNENTATARQYFRETKGECRGVHLFFQGGYSHLALTYQNEGAWVRRYSLVFPWSESNQNLEFAFVFYFWGTFASCCRAAPDMDRLVASLRWDHLKAPPGNSDV
jgi:hypothetical protein